LALLGGYPEVVKAGEIEKMKLLDTYKDLIVYKDIIERYRARSPLLAKLLIDHLFASFSKEFSINSFFNVLKSRNIEVSKKTYTVIFHS
jgi:predicted AAA+ superfamily ATPase